MVATETSAQLVAVAGSGSSDLGWGHRNNSGTEMVQVALRPRAPSPCEESI
jgi:hypothetical protein